MSQDPIAQQSAADAQADQRATAAALAAHQQLAAALATDLLLLRLQSSVATGGEQPA